MLLYLLVGLRSLGRNASAMRVMVNNYHAMIGGITAGTMSITMISTSDAISRDKQVSGPYEGT